jgi:hypothetical protein
MCGICGTLDLKRKKRVDKSVIGITVSIKQLLFCQNIHDICRELTNQEKNGKIDSWTSPLILPPAGKKSLRESYPI